MLKGAQKRMVVLRTAGSSHFETAYFILKDNAPEPKEGQESSILEEANRILNQNFEPRRHARRYTSITKKSALILFFLGVLIGALICAVFFLALWR